MKINKTHKKSEKNCGKCRRCTYKITCTRAVDKKVQVGKDQEKAQSERDSHSKKPRWEKTKLTIRHLYHETYRKPNEQLFSQ